MGCQSALSNEAVINSLAVVGSQLMILPLYQHCSFRKLQKFSRQIEREPNHLGHF